MALTPEQAAALARHSIPWLDEQKRKADEPEPAARPHPSKRAS